VKGSALKRSRFIVGLVLVAVAALILLFTEGDARVPGAIALGVLGIVSIAVSRRS
jgi:hypothetical protein